MSRGVNTLCVPKISEMLKKRRAELGKTQREMAELLEYASPMVISNWERGLQCPAPIRFKRVAKVYKLPAKLFVDLMCDHYREELEHLATLDGEELL